MLVPANGVTWKEFFLALKERFIKDKLMDVAGSVTFFGVLALFPFLLFLVTLAGLVLRPEQVEQFIRQIGEVAPADATRIIAQQIRDLHKSQSVGLLTVGFVGAIWSASGGVVSLMDALNGLHHVEDRALDRAGCGRCCIRFFPTCRDGSGSSRRARWWRSPCG